MADEIGRRLASADEVASAFAMLVRRDVRRIGWAAGGTFRAVDELLPLKLDRLLDADPAMWKKPVRGVEVVPVETLRGEDPENTLVILYSAQQRALRERLEEFGPFRTLSAETLLRMPAVPPHCIASERAPFDTSINGQARRAIERRVLWPILRIGKNERFAIEGSGELAACVLSLCRRHGRTPVVVLDPVTHGRSLDGVPVRDRTSGVPEFRPERVLTLRLEGMLAAPDANLERPENTEQDAWQRWRALCQDLDATRYRDPEDGHRWARGHVALWERLSGNQAGDLGGDAHSLQTSLDGFTGPRLSRRELEEQIRVVGDARAADPISSRDEVRDRRVALVGPAQSLVGAARGDEIDAHDVVVRLNTTVEHLPFPNDSARDFGTRCDQLYVSYAYLDKLFEYRRDAFDRAVDLVGLREVVCVDSLLKVDAFPEAHRARVDSIREDLAVHHPHVHFRFESDLPRMLVYWLAGHAPRMGFAALVDLLVRQAKSLSLLGFTFYHGGGHLFRALQPTRLDPTTSNSGRASLHNSRLELQLLQRLCEEGGAAISLDDTLEALVRKTGPATNKRERPFAQMQVPQ